MLPTPTGGVHVPSRTASDGVQLSVSASPPLYPPEILVFAPAEWNPRNAPSPHPSGACFTSLLGQILSYGGWRRHPMDFHPGLVLGSLGWAAPDHELLCAVQLLPLPRGAAKAAVPGGHGCASHAGNSRLFNPLNYWQIPAANNPWLANDLQTACGRRFALGGSFCVGCVRRAAEPRDRLCGLRLSAWRM